MKIGILGAGSVGGTLGHAWAQKGHEVLFGVRKPDAPEIRELLQRAGGRACAGGSKDAAEFGEVIVNALPWPATRSVVTSVDLAGKVLLDATNPISAGFTGLELGTTTSGGEQVAQWAPEAKVVKIFNTTGFANMANPVFGGKPIPMFYCGEDAGAKSTAAQLAREIGFEPVDAGPLSNARMLEPLAFLWVWLANMGGLGRDFAFQIVRR